jgi:hydroxypyruvate isomerase
MILTMLRRDFLTTSALAAASVASAQTTSTMAIPSTPIKRKGRIKQGCMRVNFAPGTAFDDMCKMAASVGIVGVDLTGPKDWPTLKKFGLISTCSSAGPISMEDGFIRKEKHDQIEPGIREAIDTISAAGYPNMVAVGGQRKGMSYEQGADNVVAFLNRVKSHAEDKNVTIVLEMVNDKYVDPNFGRVDQVLNHIEFAFDIVKRVNSPKVKILFDCYHVQIMDGDVAHHLRDNIQWVGHVHTAGVPARRLIDETQELNYSFIAKTLVELGYTGYVSHEYRPTPGGDALKELARAVEIMDV